MSEVRGHFKPEFLNRLDDIILFDPLSVEQIGKIADLQVAQLQERLSGRRLTLHVTDGARDYLALDGYDPAFGARPLRRLVQREIGDQLARMILAGQVQDGDTVRVDTATPDLAELTSSHDAGSSPASRASVVGGGTAATGASGSGTGTAGGAGVRHKYGLELSVEAKENAEGATY